MRSVAWLKPVAAMAALLQASLVAAAFGPADVLAVAGGDRVRDAEIRVLARWADVEAARRGIETHLDLRPGLAYGGDVEDPAELTADLALGVEVSYRHDPVAILDAEAAHLDALRSLRDAIRRDGKDALEAFGAHVRAEIALAEAEMDVSSARTALAQAHADGDAVDVGHAQADLREAEIELERATMELLEHRAHHDRLGLAGAPDFAPVRFALPRPEAAATLAHRSLLLDVELARVELELVGIAQTMPSLSLDARYESRSNRYQLDASIGLDRGRPTVSVGAEIDAQQDDQWSIGLNARFRFDESAPQRRRDAERAWRDAQSSPAEFVVRFEREVRRAHADVAWRLEELDIARTRHDLRRDEVAALTARVDALEGGGDARATNAERAERDLVRARLLLLRNQDAVVLAWLRYMEDVDDYLALVEGAWIVADDAP